MATILQAGDIAIIGFNFDNPDEFAFIPLVDLDAGTVIKFTDNGWKQDNTFRTGEGILTWTAESDVLAGTVISPIISSVQFSADGDQILAYQGEDSNPTFIYAVNSDGAAWQTDAADSNTSAIPTGLVNGTTAVALNEIDNAIYTGITTGTPAALRAAIGNTLNWSGSNANRQTMPSGSFTVVCFLGGTHILTDRGEVPVENLNIGDRVLTADGTVEPVKWISRQTIDPDAVRNPLRGYPIHIKPGALGQNRPHRDLYVSPDHALFVDELLINAGALVNGISILATTPTEPFIYYHVELHQHSLIVAEGSATESYLPQNDDRSVFDNGAEYETLYPHDSILAYWPMKYPRVSSKRQLPRFVSQKMMAIAEELVGVEISA